MLGYYARSPLGMVTEMARSVHAMLTGHPIVDGGLVGLRKFRAEQREPITDYVTKAIHEVQQRRTSAVGLRRAPDESVESLDNLLKTRRDENPAVVRAKIKALRDVQNDLGIPLADQINVQEYDRIRTLLQPHIGRKNRGLKLMRETTAKGGDYREGFLDARRIMADENAV
jgi:hypothetical protein